MPRVPGSAGYNRHPRGELAEATTQLTLIGRGMENHDSILIPPGAMRLEANAPTCP
jgi:hypothetical protein